MTPNSKFLLQLLVTGLLIPVAAIVISVALRRDRRGPLPSWADVAAIAVCFDIVAMASGEDWSKMFANHQVQELAGLVLASLLVLSLLVWILLISIVESANERNYNFATNQYMSKGKRFFHWFFGTSPVVILFAFHLVPFLLPAELEL